MCVCVSAGSLDLDSSSIQAPGYTMLCSPETGTPLDSSSPPGRANVILFVSWFICSTAVTVNRLLNSIVEGNPNVSLLL